MQHPPRSPQTHVESAPTATSRFFVAMRNPFSPPTFARRKTTENTRGAMYSTPEERHAYSSRASHSHYLDSRPTIQQIAMGLHVSRTPHLRPAPSGPSLQRNPVLAHNPHRVPSRQARTASVSSADIHDAPSPCPQYRTRHSLPPPPPRSSMKKTSPPASTLAQPPRQLLSSGISPSVSVAASAPSPSISRPLSSLRARVSKLIPGYRPLSSPSSLGRPSSITSSASDSTRPTTPRKAVRFSTSALGIDQQS